MGIADIRKSRGVPAKRGGRIVYTGSGDNVDKYGTIVGAKNGYVRIRLDGERHAKSYHPTWELQYLDTSGPS